MVKVTYNNSAGVAETKTGTLTNGVAEFAGLDMLVKADDDAVLTVSANSNTISSGAAAGEFVDLNLAFNNFEAVAQGSGETYKADKIDASVSASSDLDFGTPSFTDADGILELDGAQDVSLTLGTTLTLTIDDSAGDNSNRVPVGTLLCVDDDDSAACSSEDIYIVTSVSAGSTEDTYTVLPVDDAGDDNYDDNDPLMYALPGSGYLTSSNHMHVYESKPTVTVDASSPSGSRSVASSDNAFVFNVAANAQEKVQVRTAKELTTCALGFDVGDNGDQTVAAAHTTVTIDGSDCRLTQVATSTADDSVSFDAGATSTINQYTRASFWLRADAAPEFADIQFGTDAAAGSGATGAIDNVSTLAYTNCTLNGATVTTATMAANTWYFCDVAIPTTTTERYFHISTHEITELASGQILYIDRLVLYNDKIELDLTGDDIDTQANGAHGLVAYLKEGSETVATGYVAKNSTASSEGGAAKVVFYPIDGTNPAIEISKGTSKTFAVQLSTSTLLAEDAGADDPLTFSIDMGTASGGTVTAGDFWWNDTNFSSATAGDQPGTSYAMSTPGIIKWLGQVANTTLSGNTVKY